MAMLNSTKAVLRLAGVLLLATLVASGVRAAETVDPKQETPHELIEKVTDVMFDVVGQYNNGDLNTEEYYSEVQALLEPVVDFPFIAKAVMGSHRSEASEEQVERFAEVFKSGLVTTYAKGIASYADSDIRIQPPGEGVKDERRVSVHQEVKHDGSTYRLSYTMAKNRSGEWKLINLVLDGVNLGRSFRSQFSQAVKTQGGNIDKVIDTWLDEM
ncbi:MlaC/ttg2D family ABC transporter substrate-binding protein [Marinimicrobium sp. ARAG 43.8]|uniref:MlaC/ttg2D family ABC transporter substrate-binding protein n=1 Tax=Marinimicrobium sp. ARAG 43.8 TaxID=3418719 RepID=UPI003CF445DF